MNWQGFWAAAPELAALGEQRLTDTDLCLLGTLRKDGSPRVSPCEVYAVDGELLLGMMWRSKKALDLLRDPSLRGRYADTLQTKIDWRPEEPYHLFAVDIESAGYIVFGDEPFAMRWNPIQGFARIKHPDAGA